MRRSDHHWQRRLAPAPRRRRSRTSSSKRFFSASLPTTQPASSAPPSSARPGAAPSPTPASAAASTSSTGCPPCSASCTTGITSTSPISSPPPPRLLPRRSGLPLLAGPRLPPRPRPLSHRGPGYQGTSHVGANHGRSTACAGAAGARGLRESLPDRGRALRSGRVRPPRLPGGTFPFRVVFVFAIEFVTSACVYSSETGTWGDPTLLHGQIANFTECSSVLVGNSLLYFLSDGEMIQEYDLASRSLTVFDTPYNSYQQKFNLMLADNGELVVSESLNRRLKLWSRELRSGGTGARWVLNRVIYLENLLPDGVFVDSVHVLGFAEVANAIFVCTVVGLFMIELKSDRVRKVCDDYGYCNLIPVVGFYTPQSRLKAPGGDQHDPPPQNATKEETLKFAHELFDMGFKAMQERNFADASDCFSRALEIRVLHYGKLAPQCASTFYRYGHALLCKALAATNPPASVSKSAPNEGSVKITATTSKYDAGSSSASGSNVVHVRPSERGGSEEGDEDGSDLHLAWKMLDFARAIVIKSPEKTMMKFSIFYALAGVYVKREDRDSAIGYYLEALAILEYLVRPDHIRVVELNFRICSLIASKVDVIPYCAKAISACKSRIRYLKNAKEGLLADKDVAASAAGQHSGKFTLEDNISSLTSILDRLQKKLEELEQAMSTPSSGIDKITKRVVSQTNAEQNVSNTVPRASSLTSQMAGSDNNFYYQNMSTAATTGSTGSSLNDSGIVSRGIKRANSKLISAEPSPKRLAADDSPSVKCDGS